MGGSNSGRAAAPAIAPSALAAAAAALPRPGEGGI
jgi:hypothetical protein